jgi:glutamate 5-kinase
MTLTQAKRLIVKVGSSLLMQGKDGTLNTAWMATLGEDLAAARARGQDVILVSSGAIALGRGRLGLSDAPLSLEQSQAAAAAGQISLAHAWQEALNPQGMTIAQILLTLEDTEQRRRYLNARSTLNALLDLGSCACNQ